MSPSVPTSISPPNPFNFTFKASFLNLFKRLKINKISIQFKKVGKKKKKEAKNSRWKATIEIKAELGNIKHIIEIKQPKT